ncbi:MAG TPA: hypothetical protein VMU08_12600 [Rhizomicrobium sp.]|nr:hypothetical protein [Rhizomicrobium sp.]
MENRSSASGSRSAPRMPQRSSEVSGKERKRLPPLKPDAAEPELRPAERPARPAPPPEAAGTN